jgi:hypothetical protein
MLYITIIFEHLQRPETLIAKRFHRSSQLTPLLSLPLFHVRLLYPSVMNRITTDRCTLWQLSASICSKRMHRKHE